jgi:hypothetical protein
LPQAFSAGLVADDGATRIRRADGIKPIGESKTLSTASTLRVISGVRRAGREVVGRS